MYEAVRAARRRAVGTKQALKAAARGATGAVYVARDAEPHVVRSLIEACEQKQIRVYHVDSMGDLGRACGIKVGAAAVAILNEFEEGGAELAYDQSTGT